MVDACEWVQHHAYWCVSAIKHLNKWTKSKLDTLDGDKYMLAADDFAWAAPLFTVRGCADTTWLHQGSGYRSGGAESWQDLRPMSQENLYLIVAVVFAVLFGFLKFNVKLKVEQYPGLTDFSREGIVRTQYQAIQHHQRRERGGTELSDMEQE